MAAGYVTPIFRLLGRRVPPICRGWWLPKARVPFSSQAHTLMAHVWAHRECGLLPGPSGSIQVGDGKAERDKTPHSWYLLVWNLI